MRKTVTKVVTMTHVKACEVIVKGKEVELVEIDEVISGKLDETKAINRLKKLHGDNKIFTIVDLWLENVKYQMNLYDFIDNAEIIGVEEGEEENE